jgi:3'(2'), 5'-bisphosphate nucleotidase
VSSAAADALLLFRAVEAAYAAGEAILEVYGQSDFGVQLKQDNSPLTRADKAAHTCIHNTLQSTGLPLLSEEGAAADYCTRRRWERFWLVDPLDGTKEFIKRNGEFTVNIALIQKGLPLGGVIYVPVSKVLYLALPGGGGWRSALSVLPHSLDSLLAQSQQLPLPPVHSLFTVVASRSHLSPQTQHYIELLRQHHGPLELISCGSSLKLCMIAEGAAQCYPRFAPTMEWDTAAGHALVRECGGELFDVDHCQPLRYNKEELTNPGFIAQPSAMPVIMP